MSGHWGSTMESPFNLQEILRLARRTHPDWRNSQNSGLLTNVLCRLTSRGPNMKKWKKIKVCDMDRIAFAASVISLNSYWLMAAIKKKPDLACVSAYLATPVNEFIPRFGLRSTVQTCVHSPSPTANTYAHHTRTADVNPDAHIHPADLLCATGPCFGKELYP